MHHLLFMKLLTGKTESGYRKIYDTYATRLYAFILPVVENKSTAEEIVTRTFTTLWDEPPVLNLRHPDPFLYLLQKTVAQVSEQEQATEILRPNIMNRVKSLRREPQLKVVTPRASQHSLLSDRSGHPPSA